ncbi:ATP synthase subunit H-like protein [Encephalitozoon hellem ATCC 50504]|uniref:ATP synthase subunit H n=1 Tax=Encephalitozoon hellem TaxID=27973 RepID=A0A9Q9FBY4_ENCHE|nr:ATP synthase subunit H-like protein [Encephalitozoon hellem ATCC 50504]AHL28957.1 ATP synthase subunit H-like protein [Encephalitozoon hellem ATCC 50504]UTX43705.1 ATP synthase subunit H [Encephalitozoon hellem]WEL39181.1 ATP synthase subunit H [Encephalitozoon hellem]
MTSASVLLCSIAFILVVSIAIVILTRGKSIRNKDEIRIGLIGALAFGYIAWACVYMSQIKPFVDPE